MGRFGLFVGRVGFHALENVGADARPFQQLGGLVPMPAGDEPSRAPERTLREEAPGNEAGKSAA
jgi:hypothetical protein